jgi:hypothetical protein
LRIELVLDFQVPVVNIWSLEPRVIIEGGTPEWTCRRINDSRGAEAERIFYS